MDRDWLHQVQHVLNQHPHDWDVVDDWIEEVMRHGSIGGG